MRVTQKAIILIAFLGIMVACGSGNVVSHATVQSFSPAQGSVANGYSGAALDEATRLSEVRNKCGTPLAEWEDSIPFFRARLKRLKYKTYDAHDNILNTTFTFVMSSSDPSLIGIDYDQSSN